MDNPKGDSYYAQKTIEHIDVLIEYIGEKTYEEMVDDQVLIDAMMFRMVQMVENMKHLSPEFRGKHPEVKWGLIIGFRNGIVHEYGNTDYKIVYEILTKDLITLRKSLNK